MSSEAAKQSGEVSQGSNDDSWKFIQKMKNENKMKSNLESYESPVVEKKCKKSTVEITKVSVNCWRNKEFRKYMTPQWISDCCMTSKVQAEHISKS